MPTMPKPTDGDREYFRALLPDDARVEVKPMFGSLGAFVNGNMFLGLYGRDVGVKLDDAARAELLAEPGAGPFGPAERPMGGYVALPPAWRSEPERAAPWVGRALEHVGSLPPKRPKAKRA
ncbi:TfoX/Sxy family protein [Pseudonocardia nigra]|uniref:TfoX/Sxy family protein n=1 Tax=Pseudonocardia nigra TaxID=1921578 RepID=UPI001C5E766D|nr:TfoX/Sxy family protein [Pseudonocardia nigra]